MRFIGLDLAWSARNRSGGAVIEGDAAGGRLVCAALLADDEQIVAFVTEHAGAHALVAIDAPLVVPNETGRRLAEAQLGTVFARYHAGAHPANRRRLAVDGTVRGEEIVRRLAAAGFRYQPHVTAQLPVRQVLEVYPHPAMVALFGLQRVIPYKTRPSRGITERHAAFKTYQDHLRALESATPALRDARELIDRPVEQLMGPRLKDYEDQLDGLMCAYIAHYLWRWGMGRARVFGDPAGAAITTPLPPHFWNGGTAEDAENAKKGG